jgi:outer membrane protein OmpA-like peptidoglycan-associated protein/tetratricopeptide (TPR) repeat protein
MRSHFVIFKQFLFMNRFFWVLVSSFFLHHASAQTMKADQNYRNGNYAVALPMYEKAEKKDSSVLLYRKLSDCYLKLRRYEEAEKSYQKLTRMSGSVPADRFAYALVLKCNSNYSGAAVQFEKIISEDNNNLKAQQQLNLCRQHLQPVKTDAFYKVFPVTDLNSSGNDYAPCVQGKFLYYTGVQQSNAMYSAVSADPEYALFRKDISTDASGLPSFNKKINKAPEHLNIPGNNGSCSWSDSSQTLFFTHVENTKLSNDSGALNKPAIYFSLLKNNKWSKPEAFSWNDARYAFQHPAISPDGKSLVFSSDMPGGEGKTDLYISELKEGKWTKPRNLGHSINTAENEVFPSWSGNRALYFSSDGRTGFGGLDLYKAFLRKGDWKFSCNLGAPINSSRDDFSICFLKGDSVGLISSDRAGGKGGDDMYLFRRMKNYGTMKGQIFLDRSLSHEGTRKFLTLHDLDGNLVDETYTDPEGRFRFEYLDPDGTYALDMNESDGDNLGKLYLTDENKKRIVIAAIKEKRAHFQLVPTDLTTMKEVDEEDPSFYMGMTLVKNNATSTPVAGEFIDMVNKDGKVIQSAQTNTFGAYAFRKIPESDSFSLVVRNQNNLLNPKEKFLITNLNGELVQKSETNIKNQITFGFYGKNAVHKQIARVEPAKLFQNFKGTIFNQDNIRLKKVKLTIQNESGSFAQQSVSDEEGKFSFNRLPLDDNYYMSFDETDTTLLSQAKKVMISDAAGNNILVVELRRLLKVKYKILGSDQNSLAEVFVDDPWLKLFDKSNGKKMDTIVIRESASYPLNEWKVTEESKIILNKVLQVMKANPVLKVEIGSHTDSRGSDQYNLSLSKKRANAAMDYLVKSGVDSKRLKAIGYGEQVPLNRCINDADCSEDEFSVNRRTEFKVLY